MLKFPYVHTHRLHGLPRICSTCLANPPRQLYCRWRRYPARPAIRARPCPQATRHKNSLSKIGDPVYSTQAFTRARCHAAAPSLATRCHHCRSLWPNLKTRRPRPPSTRLCQRARFLAPSLARRVPNSGRHPPRRHRNWHHHHAHGSRHGHRSHSIATRPPHPPR